MILSHAVLLRMRNVLGESCRESFPPMPPPVRTNFVVFPPGCGDSVADF